MDKHRRHFIGTLVAAALGLMSTAATQKTPTKKSTTKKAPAKTQTNNLKMDKQLVAPKSVPVKAAALQKTASKSLTPNPRMGTNLSQLVDWNTEFPLVDLFKMSREWISQIKDAAWGAGAPLELDENGWIKRLPANGFATTFLSSIEDGHYPSGEYLVLYDGEGKMDFSGHPIKSAKPGRIIVNVDAKKGTFRLDVLKTDPRNYIRNIRVILPGYEKTYQDNPWNTQFLDRWQGMACFRFMDMMATNNSKQSSWVNRPKATDASFADKGISLELMVDLANRQNCDAWFCIPHMADDDYVKQFATYVKAHLNPNLKAWVEYSNEVWNGSFGQSTYAAQQGERLKLGEPGWDSKWKFYAYRAVQIFNIWQTVFGGNERFVRILASQEANHEVAKGILSYKLIDGKLASQYADVLAVTHYVGLGVTPTIENGINDQIVAGWSLEKIFERMTNVEFETCKKWLIDNKKIADQHGLKLVAYESGTHLVGGGGAEGNDKLTALFTKAAADKRNGELASKTLVFWDELGGDLICNFTSIASWTKWGNWGIMQHFDDKPTPKFNAMMDWAKSHGQIVNY
jgi:hypothetical protein